MVRARSQADTAPWRCDERFGPFRVLELVGEGRLATVCRAVDTRIEREHELALKRMHATAAGQWQLVDAFLGEAQVASQLRHPQLARTYDFGKLAGTFYAAVELVRGPSLADVLRQSRTAAGAIPTEVVVELMLQLCDVLDPLHGASPAIVHRGLSPAHLIVAADGRTKLVDFGIAKAARGQGRQGMRRDVLAYIAPESVFGRTDPRGDLFAVGAIGHELLVGRPLFAGATDAATVHNVCSRVVRPPSRWAPDVSHELDDIVLTALQRDPALRWQSAAAMRVALTAVADELGGRAQLVAHVREWVAWAFACPPRRDSRVAHVLDALESA